MFPWHGTKWNPANNSLAIYIALNMQSFASKLRMHFNPLANSTELHRPNFSCMFMQRFLSIARSYNCTTAKIISRQIFMLVVVCASYFTSFFLRQPALSTPVASVNSRPLFAPINTITHSSRAYVLHIDESSVLCTCAWRFFNGLQLSC